MNIKPITLKPATAAPGAAGAQPATSPAPAAASPVPPAPAAAASPIPAASGIKPISLKPLTPQAPAAPKPLSSAADSAPTIRMTPVASPAAPSAAPAAPKGIRPISIKPPTPVEAPDVTAQAIKGKTSRISLDAALAGIPTAGKTAAIAMGRMTTNLSGASEAAKRQTAAIGAAPLASAADSSPQTIRIARPVIAPSASAAPAKADGAEAPTVKRKPLTLKKPGAASPSTASGVGSEDDKPTLRLKSAGVVTGSKVSGAPDAEGKPASPMGSDIEAPPSALGGAGAQFQTAPKESVNVFFPIVAAASVLVLIGLVVVELLKWQI